MNFEPQHHEIEDLLGAYAINALDPDERLLVTGHLAACHACRAEVDCHHEVTALLASSEAAPDDVWASIINALEEAPPPLDLAPVVNISERRPRSVRILTAVTTVAAVAIAVLGFRLVDQDRRLDGMQTAMAAGDLRGAALAATANPAAIKVDLRSPEGPAAAQAILLPDGRGYLLADGLPGLAPDRTYQLWALIDGQRISAGTLGTQPKTAAFHASGKVAGFAVTEEQAGGVVASKHSPILVGWARSA